ncbi:MAG: hypothetical protein WA865_00930 [Spirulinaceae cyanobacterium]
MPTIAVNNEVITVIIIFTVEPKQQQELLDAIAEFLEIVKQQPGFGKEAPYWEGIAENEHHLYQVVFTASAH